MFRPLICVLAVVVATALLSADDAPPSPEPKPPRPARPVQPATRAIPVTQLDGKAVAITIKSDPEYGIYLEDIQMRRLGGGSFLVGRGVDSGAGEWTAGRTIWVAIDDISEIIEFDDADDLRKTLEPPDERPDA